MINSYKTSVDTKDEPVVITDLPSAKEQEVVRNVFDKFRRTADRRNRNFQNFDGDNLISYISDAVDRDITNVFDRDGIEDWQARAHVPFTRNKVNTVLSRVIQVLPIATFKTIGEDDPLKGRVLTDIYHYSEDVDGYEDFMVDFLREAIVKGTAVAYEGHVDIKRKLRKKADGKIKTGTEKRSKIFSKLVRLEDFYPSSVGIKKIKDMPYCFWRDVKTYEEFLGEFSMFPEAKRVQASQTFLETDARPFYTDFISAEVGENNVEVIRYYSKTDDEFVILANGVWLNAYKPKETEFIEPLPFDHKELPFWNVIFESFGDSFFYGKSLADKLKSMQDVLNVLTNMLLDQSFLTVFEPLLMSGFDDIEDDYLRPGRRITIDTQGLPLNQAVMPLKQDPPSNWHQFILAYTKGIMEESSADQVTSGQAGVGERTTAREISAAAEGVEAMLGMFGRLAKSGIKSKASLRGALILQYWTRPQSPFLYNSMKKNEGDAFNVFKLSDGIMTGGKRGRKVVELFADKKNLPTKEDLQARQDVFEADTGKRIEITAVPASYIRHMETEVELVTNPRTEMNKDMEKGLVLEKARVYMSFFPDLVDREQLLSDIAEAYGDDPTEVIKKQEPGPAGENANGELDSGANTNPEGNIANNMARSAVGGERSSNSLNMLG